MRSSMSGISIQPVGSPLRAGRSCHGFTARVLATALLLSGSQPQHATAAAKPNVVIIDGDDVGFSDVVVNGAKLIPDPNIDRLASEGLNFLDAHSSASTPSLNRKLLRADLQTQHIFLALVRDQHESTTLKSNFPTWRISNDETTTNQIASS